MFFLRLLQKRARCKKLDSLERMKREQVCIASNDVCCQSTYGKREKLIVFGIAACGYLHMNIDPGFVPSALDPPNGRLNATLAADSTKEERCRFQVAFTRRGSARMLLPPRSRRARDCEDRK